MTTRSVEMALENTINGILLCKMLLNGLASLSHNKDYLDDLNVFPVSDSDTGTNMKNTFEKGAAALKAEDSFHSVISVFAKGMLIGSRGNSGLILSQYFGGIQEYTMGKEAVTVADMCGALQHAYDLAYRAVLRPVDGTMLTVMRDGIKGSLPRISDETSVREFFGILAEEMFLSARETVGQMDILRENNVVDSGALGLYLIFDGMKRTLHDESHYFDCEQSGLLPKRAPGFVKSVSFFRYCTEFVLKAGDERGKGFFVSMLEKRGDSIVATMDEDILKVHIHTNKPQEIMKEFSGYGDIVVSKVDDLFLTQEFERLKQRKHEGFALVAFTSGEGNASVLEQLGADVAFDVPFGYSPDEDELKMLVGEFLNENLIVFPCSGEIQERFKRIRWFSNLQNLYVVESDGLPRTFFTLLSLVFPGEFEDVVKSLESLKKHKVIQTSATFELVDNHVRYSGFLKKKTIVKNNLAALLCAIAGEDVLRPCSTVVVFGGKHCQPDDADIIRAHFEGNKDIEFTWLEGRQCDCDFIIGAY